jgi:hypothetical protein
MKALPKTNRIDGKHGEEQSPTKVTGLKSKTAIERWKKYLGRKEISIRQINLFHGRNAFNILRNTIMH